MALGELQNLIKEADTFLREIEEKHVELAFLQIIIKCRETVTNQLGDVKEELDDEKKRTDEANEEQEKSLKAKEEANKKRMIAKL
jgi:hypothetical protein